MRTDTESLHYHRRQELAAFLQTCRKRLTPEQVGLFPGERRRVKGLRREEVAALAGISITWYTWLEQGRSIHVSEITLDHLAQALCLSEAERTYLFWLAEADANPLPPLLKTNLTAAGSHSLQTLLHILDPQPALIRNQYWDVLAWNTAEISITPWPSLPPESRNILLYLFTDPAPRQMMPNWEEYARGVLQVFRLTSIHLLPDARFAFLIHTLQEKSREFDCWWQEYTVQQNLPPELEVSGSDGTLVRYSIVYLTFPLHPPLAMRVLLPQTTPAQGYANLSDLL